MYITLAYPKVELRYAKHIELVYLTPQQRDVKYSTHQLNKGHISKVTHKLNEIWMGPSWTWDPSLHVMPIIKRSCRSHKMVQLLLLLLLGYHSNLLLLQLWRHPI